MIAATCTISTLIAITWFFLEGQIINFVRPRK